MIWFNTEYYLKVNEDMNITIKRPSIIQNISDYAYAYKTHSVFAVRSHVSTKYIKFYYEIFVIFL